MKKLLTVWFLGWGHWLMAQNEPPQVSLLSAQWDAASKQLTLHFDLADAEGDPLDVSVFYSTDGGNSFLNAAVFAPTGDVGNGITPGSGKSVILDLSALTGTQKMIFRVLADDAQPINIQQMVDEVDSLRMKNMLRFVEGIRHRTAGAAHLKATRDTIQRSFQQYQFKVQLQDVPMGNLPGRNIIGNHVGAILPRHVAIIDAHFDTVSNAPGADDNGSGTVGMLEAARVLSKYRFRKTLRFIGFDLEEVGLLGSIRYVAQGLPPTDVVEGVFNFEMIGYYTDMPGTQDLPTGFNLLFPQAYNAVASQDFRGNFIANVGNTLSQGLVTLFHQSAKNYVPQLRVIDVVAPGNATIAPDLRRSDHAPFWDAGKKAIMLTDGAEYRNDCYHTPADTTSEKLNFTFMSNVVKATVAAAATLAEPIHADWKDLPVELTLSSTTHTADCRREVRHRSSATENFWISSAGCPLVEQAVAEIYDEKGVLIASKRIQIPGDGERFFNIDKKFPPGIYLLTITAQEIILTQKIAIP